MIAVYRQRQKTPNTYHENNQYWNVRDLFFPQAYRASVYCKH
jgi:hypothetical protein